ncbi:MAG: hypothetical protein AB7V43_22125 [Acidimicrobiia bacterium]
MSTVERGDHGAEVVDSWSGRLSLPGDRLAVARDDAVMARSDVVCVVCQRSRARGGHGGDVFVCAQCRDDARQLIEIQDSIWGVASNTPESTGDLDE